MSKLIVVSNRLPVTVERRKGQNRFRRSVGGVATGLAGYCKSGETLWVGWAETPVSRMDAAQREELRERLRSDHGSEPVFLTEDDLSGFYYGFSNRTLWPLFHYFARYTEFNTGFWRAYERVNRKYRDAVLAVYEPGDRIWVHDYQLLLLPGMLRKALPDAPIGFFLHIPFPSSEMFRLLPWRRELLEGLLGADLIGFHTHDYVRHFISSVRSLLGYEDRDGRLTVDGRMVLVDAFPMGIDYERYASGSRSPGVSKERDRLMDPMRKLVLSIDRLDYTKGIPERLRAFDRFLEVHPEWKGRVSLVCVAVPSRSRVWRYRELKREVDEIVGDINGRHGTLEWTPVRYLYRSLGFNMLLGLYAASDVTMVTPLRDGMNLIAKEYLAAHCDSPGVLILSEFAGAARELSDAIIVNPHDEEAVVEALHQALVMPAAEQTQRGEAMCRRLKRYDVVRWAEDFLGRLEETMMRQLGLQEYRLTDEAEDRLVAAFDQAEGRLLVLDYDGTLVPFAASPGKAAPDPELRDLLGELAQQPGVDVVLASGRDRETLESWFGELPIALIADHGAWVREPDDDWVTLAPLATEWKAQVRPVLDLFTDRTPGSFVEDKQFSVAWHYRMVQSELAHRRAREVQEAVASLAQSFGLSVLAGNRVIEIKSSAADKGIAAHRWMARDEYGFVLAIGDDVTDEDVFLAAPPHAWTVKVGSGSSQATFAVQGNQEVRALLRRLTESLSATAEKDERQAALSR